MRKRVATVVVAGVVSFAVALSGTNMAVGSPRVPSAASEASTSATLSSHVGSPTATFAGISQDQIAKFDQYVFYDSAARKFVINVPQSVQVGDPVGYRTAVSAVAEANSGLSQVTGVVSVDQSENRVRVFTSASSVAPLNEGGWTGVEWYWWGVKVFLSNYATNVLLGLLAGGAVVADIVAYLSSETGAPAAVAKVIGWILGFFAAAVLICNAQGNGVAIIEAPGSIYCRTQ